MNKLREFVWTGHISGNTNNSYMYVYALDQAGNTGAELCIFSIMPRIGKVEQAKVLFKDPEGMGQWVVVNWNSPDLHHNLFCLSHIKAQVVSATPFSQMSHFIKVKVYWYIHPFCTKCILNLFLLHSEAQSIFLLCIYHCGKKVVTMIHFIAMSYYMPHFSFCKKVGVDGLVACGPVMGSVGRGSKVLKPEHGFREGLWVNLEQIMSQGKETRPHVCWLFTEISSLVWGYCSKTS